MTRAWRWVGALALLGVGLFALHHWTRGRAGTGALTDDGAPPSTESAEEPEPEALGPIAREALASPETETPVLEPQAEVVLEEGAFAAADLYGRVIDMEGEPIPSARLVLFAGEDRNLGPALAETDSDDSGRFRISDIGEFERLVLHAEREGYRPLLHRSGSTGIDLELRMTDARPIRGQVLDAETGAPVPGAIVFTRMTHWTAEGYADRQVVTADTNGHYVLEWMRLEGDVTLWAHRAGEGPEPYPFQVKPDQREGYDLELGSARKLVLEFVDSASEAPLAKLPITVDWHVTLPTDGSGLLELPFPSASMRQFGVLVLQADGYGSTHLPLNPEDERVRVPMVAAARIDGLVLDPDGNPCAGAAILFEGARFRTKLGSGDDALTIAAAWKPVVTDEDGRFTAPGRLPQEGTFGIRASHAGYLDSETVSVALPESGSRPEVRLQLRRGATLAGTVLVNGVPQSQQLLWSSGPLHGRAHSNASGSYRMTGLPLGTLSLRAIVGSEWREQEVELTAEHELRDLEFVYRPASIAGTVLSADGSPASGETVTAFEPGPSLLHVGDTSTAADGTFVIELSEKDGVRYEVHAGQGAARAVETGLPAGASGLTLQLTPVTEIRLEIRDAESQKALSHCDIWWRESGSESLVRVNRSRRAVAPDPDGRYSIVVPQRLIDLVFEAREDGFARTEITGVQVTDQAAADPLWVHMKRVAEGD